MSQTSQKEKVAHFRYFTTSNKENVILQVVKTNQKKTKKVLTLAEQFLAAMPDRIKFESTTVDDDSNKEQDNEDDVKIRIHF